MNLNFLIIFVEKFLIYNMEIQYTEMIIFFIVFISAIIGGILNINKNQNNK